MMDVDDISRIVRDVIAAGGFPCTLLIAQMAGPVWRVTLRDDEDDLVSFDVAIGLSPAHVREAVQKHLEAHRGWSESRRPF
jgi:hypothetical protein